jgi:hypothetical protein
MPRSPKGLIENRSVTPEEMPQLGSPDDLIAFWKWFAESHIEANPATDDTLDRTAAAVAVLDRLQVIEHSRAAAQRNPASGSLYGVGVCHGMLLATRVHQLAIIDNEKAIAAVPKCAEGARDGAARRVEGLRPRNHEMAQEFLKRQGGRMSNTALMAAIGKARGLKRRASINAVKSGLEDPEVRDAPTEIGGASDDDDHAQPALPLALPRRAGRSPGS